MTFFFFIMVFLLHHDVLCVMWRMNPSNIFLFSWQNTQRFWAEVINWCSDRGGGGLLTTLTFRYRYELLGKEVHKDNLLINNILLVGEQYIYSCWSTKTTLAYEFSRQDSITFIRLSIRNHHCQIEEQNVIYGNGKQCWHMV